MNPMHSPMLTRFREGVPSYHPEIKGLVLESGDPQASLEKTSETDYTEKDIL